MKINLKNVVAGVLLALTSPIWGFLLALFLVLAVIVLPIYLIVWSIDWSVYTLFGYDLNSGRFIQR